MAMLKMRNDHAGVARYKPARPDREDGIHKRVAICEIHSYIQMEKSMGENTMDKKKLNDSELETVAGGNHGTTDENENSWFLNNEAIEKFRNEGGLDPNGIAARSVRTAIEEKLKP